MKFLSCSIAGKATYGLLTANGVVDAGARFGERFPDLKAVIAAGALDEVGAACANEEADAAVDDIDFLPVIPNPAKIFCVGLNYESHRKETGRDKTAKPTIFTRFADTQVGHGQPIIKPAASEELDYEAELAVVIGKGGRHIAEADAMDHVAGYSCYNDASVRDWQRHTTQFTPGKNFPATGGLGPHLVTPDEVGDVHDLAIQLRLNGETLQDARTDLLIFPIPVLIEYLSAFTTLGPGDVIATGTPGGVGFKRDPQVFMQPGDTVEVEIENVGLLRNPVVAE